MSGSSSDKGDMDIDWYAMLGVAEDATAAVIQKAVRKLGLRYHHHDNHHCYCYFY